MSGAVLAIEHFWHSSFTGSFLVPAMCMRLCGVPDSGVCSSKPHEHEPYQMIRAEARSALQGTQDVRIVTGLSERPSAHCSPLMNTDLTAH
jgi:hypothetical protein